MNVVITGSSRGIGRELVAQAVAKGARVLAIARDTSSLAEFGTRVETLTLDLTGADVAERLAGALETWDVVDVLINDAGVFRKDTSVDDFLHSFHVNAVAPFVVTEAVLPWLRKARAPRVVHVTSKMGSIADNSSGGSYAYRASKSALNMINRSLSVDHDWLTTIVLHPGWVQTDMGGAGAPTPVPESAAGIWRVIERLKPADSGEFYDFKGEAVPW